MLGNSKMRSQASAANRRSARHGPVTDILVWVDCYASLVSVLSVEYPTKTPEFMAYQKIIVYASKSFTGDGWVTYDTCYRRKAAAGKSLDWSRMDFTLYNQSFAGRAKTLPRCRFCCSELHQSSDCPLAPELPDQRHLPPMRFEPNKPIDFVCQLLNNKPGNRCRFTPCKFRHSCSECGGTHPASQCRRGPTAKHLRINSPKKIKRITCQTVTMSC